jgi:hypothetical protein
MYGQVPTWLQDLLFVLGAGATSYLPAQWARRYGKATVPALTATGAGIAALVARGYARHAGWAALLDGAAGGGVGYGWMFAAANTFGRGNVPLMTVPSAPPKSSPANIVNFQERRAAAAPRSLATRGLTLGA